MAKYNQIQQKGLGIWCRDCINKEYGATLKEDDCQYSFYPYECKRCHKMKHVVIKINLIARLKRL